MKKLLKKIISVMLCIVVLFSSVSVVSATDGFAYPDGVTAENALNAVGGTDRLLETAIPLLTGKSLSELTIPMLCNSDTLSALLISVYGSMGEQSSSLNTLGIDVSVSGVAQSLSAYPEVKAALLKYNDWSGVSLDGVNWGVTDKLGFADAMGAVLSPFNDVLYMLLCSGTFEMLTFIKIEGSEGYKNAIMPILGALKCTDLMTQEQFTAEATANKNSMVKNIVLMLLNWLEKALLSPASSFTDSLPSFAYFSESGEMDKCMDALMNPITSNKLVELAGMLNLFDASALEFDLSTMTAGMGGDGALKLAELDMAVLASCGSLQGDTFVSDQGRAYVVIMRWLVETLKLNKTELPALMSNMSGEAAFSPELLNGLLSKDTDSIVGSLILLFTPSQPGNAEGMLYPAFSPSSVQYTPNLTEENYNKVLNEIDDLLSDFVKEGGSYNTIGQLLRGAIYTNSNISALVTGIYGAFEENGLTEMLMLLGVDTSPSGVSALLTEYDYKNARDVLNKAKRWSEVKLNGVRWGFYDGSRNGFQKALVDVLRPIYPLLRVVLAGEDLIILNSITVKGADGYNTAVIPILEALGCSSYDIKNYEAYKSRAGSDKIIDYVLEPVFDLVDDVCEKPVYTLTEKLPNIIYFMNSGSLEKCISNLLLPVTAVTDKLSGIYSMDFDTASLTSELDLNKLLSGMTESSGIKLAEFDIKALASYGTAQVRESKATLNGQKVSYTYIEANQTAVLMSLLRVLARTLKLPGNENLLMGAMGSDGGNFEAYSSSISEQFAAMTEDELIEWLYNLLFKERVKVEIVADEDYHPTIIFKEEEPNYTPLYVLGAYFAVCVVVGIIIAVNKKRLYC